MENTTSAYELNDQLRKEKRLKENNMTDAYANQLYGTSNDAATVSSSSAAADSDYSNYIAAQNQSLDVGKSTPTTKAPQTGVHLVSGKGNDAAGKDALAQKSATTPAPTASPVDYSGLSESDQKLSDDAKNEIIEYKQQWADAKARGDTAAMNEAYIQAQLVRAKNGGYISDTNNGAGYSSFGYGNLSLADQKLPSEAQDEIMYWKLQYMNAGSDEDKQYAQSMANKVREQYGYKSGDGSNYQELGPLDTEYSYTGGDFIDPYASEISGLTDTLNNDKGWDASSYDPSADAAYQSYANYYNRNGQAAANSALAQAAGNTGGIANSYAQAMAAAAQQSYAKQLSDVVPTLQANAQKAYNDNIANKQALLAQLQNASSNAYNQYNTNRNFDYNSWLQNWQNAYNMYNLNNSNSQNDLDRDWQTEQNALDRELDRYLATLR